jgi:hypothetical protein
MTNAGKFLLRAWGRDIDELVFNVPGSVAEPGDGVRAWWFMSAENREAAIAEIDVITKANGGGIVYSKDDNDHVHKLTWAKVKLSAHGKPYDFSMCFGFGYPKESVEYMFSEGNYACDCNRSGFIARYCDTEFPRHDCGDQIAVVELNVVYLEPTEAP